MSEQRAHPYRDAGRSGPGGCGDCGQPPWHPVHRQGRELVDDEHADQEPEHDERDLAEGPSEPPAIRASDRLAAIGTTGSGKSVAINHLWAIYPGQRVLIDVNDEYQLGPAALADELGAISVEKVGDIDWRCRTIHVVPRSFADGFWDDLYAAIFQRRNLCVALHESYGPTGPNRTPRAVGLVLRQGRKRNILHLAASQEPMNIAPVLYSQAQHVLLFRLNRPDEIQRLAGRFQLRQDELAAELAELPEHGYLWACEREAQVRRMPPLPLEVIDHTEQHVTSSLRA